MDNVKPLVTPGGLLFIAIYNDCGEVSRWWLHRKRRYNALPRSLRPLYAIYVWTPQELRSLFSYLRSGELRTYVQELTAASGARGMSWIHDVIDWVGGYPYEYASVSAITDFYEGAGFVPVRVRENTRMDAIRSYSSALDERILGSSGAAQTGVASAKRVRRHGKQS